MSVNPRENCYEQKKVLSEDPGMYVCIYVCMYMCLLRIIMFHLLDIAYVSNRQYFCRVMSCIVLFSCCAWHFPAKAVAKAFRTGTHTTMIRSSSITSVKWDNSNKLMLTPSYY